VARFVVPFGGLGVEDVELVGGKSANLGELTRAGFPVPHGFAVTTDAYEAGLTDEVAAAIADGYARLGDVAVAVRSSAVAEDTADASFAGVQDTYLWLRGLDEVLDGVRRCWASYWNPEAVAYRAEHGVAAGAMSVAVQAMVDARVAGVMFTLNPVSGDPSTIAIDASWGLGVGVVGGAVTPDSFLLSKVTREVVRSEIGSKDVEVVAAPDGHGTVEREVEDERRSVPCLAGEELARLAELARQVERHYGRHQDLEWAFDRAGTLYLLQARPETVWSRRREKAAGSLAAVANPFASVVRKARS
jgi:phosphoenolpyruvate synthase/pyruvate phosphate dikinase